MKKLLAVTSMIALLPILTFAEVSKTEGFSDTITYGLSFTDLLTKWGVALGWIIVAALGFAFATGLSIKVFDLLTTNIDEWEEIKKGNMAMALILVSVIVMMGLIIYKIV